jgi:hypothetical protein
MLAALIACGVILNYASADAKSQPHGRTARVASGNDNATLYLVHANGSTLYEQGHASGSLPGTVHAWLDIGAKFAGRFVFYTSSGTISGDGAAKSHQGRYPYVSFSGTANITSGTHRYVRTHGSLGFYGVLNRESDVVQFQTRGTLTY